MSLFLLPYEQKRRKLSIQSNVCLSSQYLKPPCGFPLLGVLLLVCENGKVSIMPHHRDTLNYDGTLHGQVVSQVRARTKNQNDQSNHSVDLGSIP